MRQVAVVQARLSSKRFPRKCLADLNGKPVIQHVIDRAWQITGIDEVVLAVPGCDLLAFKPFGESAWLVGFSERYDTDVLGRYRLAAEDVSADVVMRLTGDCPVFDPIVAGQVLELFHASQPCDFASNDTLISGWPDGFDVSCFSRAALETAAAQATELADREHIECWFKRPENGMRCVTLMAPEKWTGPKLSVDCEDDLRVVREWLAQCG